jgi:Flp pilus assembly protein TadD
LQRKVEAAPQDAVAAAELALAWLDRDDRALARRWALAAQRIDAKQPLAAYVLARLKLADGDQNGAARQLEAVHDPEKPQEEVLILLAALKLKSGDVRAAESLYQIGERSFPASDHWVKGLARVYLQSGEPEELAPVLRRWSQREPHNVGIHKKLAQLALGQRDFAAAAASATQALRIDVQDAEVHALLATALTGQEKPAAAIDEYEVAIRLDSQQPDCYVGLAKLQIRLGRKDDARLVLGRLRELAPDHSALPELEANLKP